jgi:hypothetical protein
MNMLKRLQVLFVVFLSSMLFVNGYRAHAAAGGAAQIQPEGILQSLTNADIAVSGDEVVVTRRDHAAPVEMLFKDCQGLGIRREQDQWWVLPINPHDSQTHDPIDANSALWILPVDAHSADHSWHLQLHDGEVSALGNGRGLRVTVHADKFELSKREARPHSDPFGNKFSFQIAGGAELEDALAGFYWGTMLPSVVEKTMAANFPYSSGYVLSTLKVSAYAGSYPAVDHEFQIKGRLAMGSDLDRDIVKRMIEMQFKLMSDDPEHLSRAPTSVQPDGRREYHVRRNSMDDKQNAAMFPLTANIEVIEEAWHYYLSTKDAAWLKRNIENLEHAAAWTLASVDQYGRVWSDVYYEDQVIKDGRETQAQAFAAYTFNLLARMEDVLARHAKAAGYTANSKDIARALIEPLPMGYWDEKNQRFVDWVDRDGKVHDHIHLLANAMPVYFGYATQAQTDAVRHLIDANGSEFERFPSFLSADIAAYDNTEIGNGGPYDLSAAGRYWYWDAAYRESRNQNGILLDQLKAVAAEGAKDDYFMGERYDMDHVYYVDGKNAHGAEKYYEYPNVFTAVLISKLLGLSIPADADVLVEPRLTDYGTVELGTPEYALRYSYDEGGFTLSNLAGKQRTFKVDLSALGAGTTHYRLSRKGQVATEAAQSSDPVSVTLEPRQEARWLVTR